MSNPHSTIHRYIVKELAPTEHEADEASLTIVCEPITTLPGASDQGFLSLRLKVGTTPEEARAIASTLQAKVKGLCRLQPSGGGAA